MTKFYNQYICNLFFFYYVIHCCVDLLEILTVKIPVYKQTYIQTNVLFKEKTCYISFDQ